MRTTYAFLPLAFVCVSAIGQEASLPRVAQVDFGEIRELLESLTSDDQQLADLHRQLAALDPITDTMRLNQIRVERQMLISRMGSEPSSSGGPIRPAMFPIPRQPDHVGRPFQEERELLEKIEALNTQLAKVREDRLLALESEEKEIRERQRARLGKSIEIESERIRNKIRARERSIVMGIIGENFTDKYPIILDIQEATALLYCRHEPVDITEEVKKKLAAAYNK